MVWHSIQPRINAAHDQVRVLQARIAKAVPTGPDWIHEVKYDGYRGRVVRDGKTVKLLSKSGLDWTWRLPWVVETALKIKQQRFIIERDLRSRRARDFRLQRPDSRDRRHPAFLRVMDTFS